MHSQAVIDERLPPSFSQVGDDIDEHNLTYVAASRAQKALFINNDLKSLIASIDDVRQRYHIEAAADYQGRVRYREWMQRYSEIRGMANRVHGQKC